MARTTARAATGGALAALLSATALTALSACSGPSGESGGTDDSGAGSRSGTASAPPPGRYQTLPEPCGSVSRTTLRALLPDSPDYAGDAALTYDNDRRVGCTWTGTEQGADRRLVIDFERVVSYDPAVSDEDKAAQGFAKKAAAAHIPDRAPDPGDSAPVPQPSTSGTPSAGTGDTSPRRVGGIGDEAYLNDSLGPGGAGQHQEATVVFRTANVLVTVDFSQWSTGKPGVPSGFALQLGAHGLAQELARAFTR